MQRPEFKIEMDYWPIAIAILAVGYMAYVAVTDVHPAGSVMGRLGGVEETTDAG